MLLYVLVEAVNEVEGEVDGHADQAGYEGLEKGKGGDEIKGTQIDRRRIFCLHNKMCSFSRTYIWRGRSRATGKGGWLRRVRGSIRSLTAVVMTTAIIMPCCMGRGGRDRGCTALRAIRFGVSFTIPARKSVTLFHRCLRAREYIGSTYNTIIFYTILCKYVRPQKMATAARAALPGHNSMALIFITASY